MNKQASEQAATYYIILIFSTPETNECLVSIKMFSLNVTTSTLMNIIKIDE